MKRALAMLVVALAVALSAAGTAHATPPPLRLTVYDNLSGGMQISFWMKHSTGWSWYSTNPTAEKQLGCSITAYAWDTERAVLQACGRCEREAEDEPVPGHHPGQLLRPEHHALDQGHLHPAPSDRQEGMAREDGHRLLERHVAELPRFRPSGLLDSQRYRRRAIPGAGPPPAAASRAQRVTAPSWNPHPRGRTARWRSPGRRSAA
jgi:hypothetical protein